MNLLPHYYDELGLIMEAGHRTEFEALDKLADWREKDGTIRGAARKGFLRKKAAAGQGDDPGVSPTDIEKDFEADQKEHCRECGTMVKKDDRHCRKCGGKIIVENKTMPVTRQQKADFVKKERGEENVHDTGGDAAQRDSDAQMDKQGMATKSALHPLKKYLSPKAFKRLNTGFGTAVIGTGLYGAHKAHQVLGPILNPKQVPGGITHTASVKRRVINPIWNIRNAKRRYKISEALARTRR